MERRVVQLGGTTALLNESTGDESASSTQSVVPSPISYTKGEASPVHGMRIRAQRCFVTRSSPADSGRKRGITTKRDHHALGRFVLQIYQFSLSDRTSTYTEAINRRWYCLETITLERFSDCCQVNKNFVRGWSGDV